MYSKRDAFRIDEQRRFLNTVATISGIRQVDDGRRVDEPVALVDDADVVDRNAPMLVAAEASVNPQITTFGRTLSIATSSSRLPTCSTRRESRSKVLSPYPYGGWCDTSTSMPSGTAA